MFVLTNSSAANYLPGTAMDPLRIYVAELAGKGINITLNNQSVFCLDNEGFRYQCGMKNDKFKAEFKNFEENFKKSWTKSREVIFELFKAVTLVQGHTAAESTSISEARIIIQTLMGPLAKVCTIIEEEMSKSVKETQIQSLMENGNLIKKEIAIEKFEHPQCVCLSCAAKTKNNPKNAETQIEFTQICHKRCILPDTVPEKFPEPKLIDCAAFDGQGKCQKCGCHYLKHIRITQKTIQKILQKPKAPILSRKKAEEIYSKLLSTLQSEQTFVWETVIQLAKYLQTNAIVDFNPLFVDKLKIEIEKQHLSLGSSSDVVDKLQRRLQNFETQTKMVEAALENMQISEISEINIQTIFNKIISLKIHGSIVKQFL
uniref:DUF8206 domain-containing protein n=1 Tax=Panagrolaimus superbus TaxID=310955 RepID=A0A914Y7K1_9BILA